MYPTWQNLNSELHHRPFTYFSEATSYLNGNLHSWNISYELEANLQNQILSKEKHMDRTNFNTLLKSLSVEENFIKFGCFWTHILIFCKSFRKYLAKLCVIPNLPLFARIYPRCFGSLPVDEEDGRAQFTNTHQSGGYVIRSSRNSHKRREEIGSQNTQLKTNTAIRKIQS